MNFSKNLTVRISIWFEMGKNRKKIWHSLTTAADPVLNNFISERVTVNSNDFLSRTIIGHDSTPRGSHSEVMCLSSVCLWVCLCLMSVCQRDYCWTVVINYHEIVVGARYRQKLRSIRRWLHSAALRCAGRDLTYRYLTFWFTYCQRSAWMQIHFIVLYRPSHWQRPIATTALSQI